MFLIDTIDHFISGDWGEESQTPESPRATYCIRGADINNVNSHNFGGTPLRYVNQSSFDNKQLQAGDIIIEKSGGSPTQSTGRVAFISQQCVDELQDVICSNFCAAFSVKENWNPKYVFYFIQHVYNSGVFFNFEGKTSGLRNLQLENAFKSIPIKQIDKPTQDRIVNVLDKIESKITLANSINRNLEQLARQLYDYWFVQFDFPNDEGKPYKSSGGEMVWNEKLKRCIPKDCLLKKIGEILDKVPKSIRLSTKEYNAKGDFPIVDQSSDKYIVGYTDEETAVVKKYPAILFGDHSCVVKYLNFEFCRGADGTQILYSANTRIPLEYLYFAVKDIKFKEGYARPYSILKDNLIIVPEEKVAAGFEIRVKPIFNSIKDNIFEIISLQRLRDELLPMLLNGQVSVYDIKSYDFMPEDIQMAAEP